MAYASGLSSKFSSNMSASIERTKLKIRQQIQLKVADIVGMLDRMHEANLAAERAQHHEELNYLEMSTI